MSGARLGIAATVFAAAALLTAPLAARAADVAEKMATCLACHGEKGQSQIENVPSLGAQVPAYSLIQLVMFRDKLRISDPMNEVAKDLSDDDIRALPDALAALPPPQPPRDQPADPARFERAKALAEQHHCNVCHRADYGGQQTVPRLADQREDYLLKTLREYKSGARHAYEPIMLEVLQPLGDTHLVELSYYLAHFR